MRIRHIIWLEEVVGKLLSKHGVRQDEVREVLNKSRHFRFVEKGHRSGENVYAAFGRTEAGRHLTVFFVCKKGDQALILSARDMTSAERKWYEKK